MVGVLVFKFQIYRKFYHILPLYTTLLIIFRLNAVYRRLLKIEVLLLTHCQSFTPPEFFKLQIVNISILSFYCHDLFNIVKI